jgi:DNA-binding MarR family transcriptional regulator
MITDMNKKNLVNEITELQQQILRTMSKDEPMAWMELHLTLAQLKCLHFIYYGGSTNLIKLAKALDVTPPNVTGIVNRLVMQELVHREEDPEDRRAYNVSVTEKGTALIEGLRESGTKRIVEILSRLTTKELTALQIGFRALAREMRASKE